MLHTTKCVAVWATVLAGAVLFSGSPALAQQANPLAPVIILNHNQNRRQEQELRETKRELKAIREGLGIEAPAPERKPLSQAIAVLMALGVAVALALVFAEIWAQWLRDLSALRSRLADAKKAGNTWAAYCVLCNLKSVAGQTFQAALLGLVIIVFSDIIYINAPWVSATDEQRKAMNDLMPTGRKCEQSSGCGSAGLWRTAGQPNKASREWTPHRKEPSQWSSKPPRPSIGIPVGKDPRRETRRTVHEKADHHGRAVRKNPS
jgi:hypothetical protein